MATTLPLLVTPTPPRSTPQPVPSLVPERTRDEPVLSVVIVNYRAWQDTGNLVRQLLRAPCTRRGAVEVVVVDNHSPRHPLLRKLRRWPHVSLRRWQRNRGFARGANEGCRLSRGRWILLLNPDVSVPDDALERILACAEERERDDPRAGILGLHLRNSDGTRQPSAGPFPTLAGTLAGLLLPRRRRKYHLLQQHDRQEVSWVTGCGLLVRRDCWADLGGLDERFFLYYEDVDLCRRAQARGWSVWYEPALRLVHHRPLQNRDVPSYLRVLTRHALLTYAAKHWPGWQSRVLNGIVTLEARARAWWAQRRGDATSAQLFGELHALTAELRHGDTRAARRRLQRVVRREEQWRDSELRTHRVRRRERAC